VHGAADGQPGCYRDQLGAWLLLEGEDPPTAAEAGALLAHAKGVYFKRLLRQVRQASTGEASPQLVAGTPAPERFPVRENGVTYELSVTEGYSVGLYDSEQQSVLQVLNCFAYTCAFSVCAALGGARVTSLDLSRKYLDWGRRNFELNGLDPTGHDFIYGDVFDWLRRLAKKARQFDVLILDPPTFSRSKVHGDFRCETDYGSLVSLALPLLRQNGVLLASANTARLAPEAFIGQVHAAILKSGRGVVQEHYVPQPPDFPVSRDEPGHLKTLWLRVTGVG
jgi:23S rRNA (cytosine1962-C5)-methyltransferase